MCIKTNPTMIWNFFFVEKEQKEKGNYCFTLLTSYWAEQVKADKYSARACFQHHDNSPRTPTYNREGASDSLVSMPWKNHAMAF